MAAFFCHRMAAQLPSNGSLYATAASVDYCSDRFDLDELIGIPEDGDS